MPPTRKGTKGDTRKKKGKEEPHNDLQGTIKIDLPLSNFLPGISEIHEQAISLYGGEVRALLKSVLNRKSLLKTLAADSDSIVPKTPKPRLGALANIARTIQLFDELSVGARSSRGERCNLFSDDVEDDAEIPANPEQEIEEHLNNISLHEKIPESAHDDEPEETDQRNDSVESDQKNHVEHVRHSNVVEHAEADADDLPAQAGLCQEAELVRETETVDQTPGDVVVKQEVQSPERVTRSQSRKASKKPKPEPISPSPEYTRASRTRIRAQEKADKALADKAQADKVVLEKILAEKILSERATAGRCEKLQKNQEIEKRFRSPHKHIVHTPTKPERREQVQKIISAQDRIRNAKAATMVQPPPEPKASRTVHTRNNDAKFQDLDQKLQEQQRRVELAQQNKNIRVKEQSKRIKLALEEKLLRVQRNREEQEVKEKEKLEKKRLKDEEREKILRSKQKSPARLATNPSSRVASPSRVINRPTAFTPRAKVHHLFDDMGSNRTPGRAAAKASKIMQLGGETAKGETFASPAREVKRKLVTKVDKPVVEDIPKLGFSDEDMKEQMEIVLREQEMLLKQDALRRRMQEEQEEEHRQLLLEEKRKAEEVEEKRRRDERLKMEAERKRREEEEEERARFEELRKQKDQERVEQLRREAEIEKQWLLEKAREEMRKKEELKAQQELEKENQVQSTPKPKNKLIEKNLEMYEMTPDKKFIPSSKDNYNIEDLSSGDETDCEDEPRKTVPEWANWSNLRKSGEDQFDPEMDTTEIFGFMPAPDIELIFGKTERKKSRRRASSGKWNSPASNPTKGMSRFLGF